MGPMGTTVPVMKRDAMEGVAYNRAASALMYVAAAGAGTPVFIIDVKSTNEHNLFYVM